MSAVFRKGGALCLRVGTGIGHGEKSWLCVLAGEVLVGELLTVNGLATSTLRNVSFNLDRFKGVEDVRCHG